MTARIREGGGVFVQGQDAVWLVLLPGFQTPAGAYHDLAVTVAGHGPTVFVPQLVRPGFGSLLGRPDVSTEAVRAAALVAAIRRDQQPGSVVLAGHSRGGLAAWLVAAHVPLEGLVLIDPVDAAGPRPRHGTFTTRTLQLTFKALIIGAGVNGPCAPESVNHRAFAAATPGCRHVVIDDLGHADVLSGRLRSPGRRLCKGGTDPDRALRRVADLIGAHLPV